MTNNKALAREEAGVVADEAKARIFPDLGFAVRGTDAEHCWVDFFGPWSGSKRDIVFTRPGSREIWELWNDRLKAQEAVLAFLAGKAHEASSLADRVIRLENVIQLACTRAEELATVKDGQRMPMLLRWAEELQL